MSSLPSRERPKDFKRRAVRGAGINASGQFIGFLLHTGGVIVLARLLTPEDFGLVTMVTAISLWVMNFGVNGFPEFIIQKSEVAHEERSALFWMHVLLAVILAAGLCALGPILARFYEQPELVGISAAMSAGVVVCAFYTHPLAFLKRELKFSQVAASQLLAVFVSTGLSIAAALYGMGYWAIVVRQLTIPVVIALVVWCASSWRPGWPRNLRLAIPGLKYATFVYTNFSLGYLSRNVDKVILGKWQGAALLGQYDRAYHLSSIPAGQLLTPLHSVALATLSRLRDDRPTFCRYFRRAVGTVAILGVLAALALMVSASDLIRLLLGPGWEQAGRVLTALSPGVGALLIYETHSWLHLSLGTPQRWLRWNIVSSVFTVATFLMAAPFGIVAMAVAFSVQKFVLLFPGLWYAARPVEINLKELAQVVWIPLTSGTLVGILWFDGIRVWLPANEAAGFWMGAIDVAMGAAVASILYLALVVVLARSLAPLKDLAGIVSLVLKRPKRGPGPDEV